MDEMRVSINTVLFRRILGKLFQKLVKSKFGVDTQVCLDQLVVDTITDDEVTVRIGTEIKMSKQQYIDILSEIYKKL